MNNELSFTKWKSTFRLQNNMCVIQPCKHNWNAVSEWSPFKWQAVSEWVNSLNKWPSPFSWYHNQHDKNTSNTQIPIHRRTS